MFEAHIAAVESVMIMNEGVKIHHMLRKGLKEFQNGFKGNAITLGMVMHSTFNIV